MELCIFTLRFAIAIDYYCALGIASTKNQAMRQKIAALSILTNLGVLIFFKYLGAFDGAWSLTEPRMSIMSLGVHDILLPLGLSFYTLQSMGYTIDVYRGRIPPERHFGYFALYVSFFPQLVAGPIERPGRLLPQLRNPKRITAKNIEAGVFIILFGLIKKVVVADRLFILLSEWRVAPEALDGWQAVIFGSVTFLAVYLDISAYTDIARGSARLFGINLTLNFNYPYRALSIGDFWQRWHISLTSWLRDYLYTPLVSLNRSRFYQHLSLIFTFLVIGLWHGPTVPYLVMGGLHGCVIVLERMASARGIRWPVTSLYNSFRWLRVQLIMNLSGVLFLSPTMETAMSIYSQSFQYDSFWGTESFIVQMHGYTFLVLLLGGLSFVGLINIYGGSEGAQRVLCSYPSWLKYTVFYILLFCILAFAERSSGVFLYFDF